MFQAKVTDVAPLQMHRLSVPQWSAVSLSFCAGLAGLFLVLDGEYWNDRASTIDMARSAGVVRREQGAVRQRSEDAWVWRDLGDREYPVAIGDTLFTGESGFARVRLESGSEVVIAPRSLVTIRQEEKNTTKAGWLARGAAQTVDIKQGHVKLRLTSKTSPLKIKSKTETYQLESMSEESAVEVNVEASQPGQSGALQITTDSQSNVKLSEVKPKEATPAKAPVLLAQGRTAILNEAQAPLLYDLSLRTVNPASGLAWYLDVGSSEGSTPVEFTWERTGKIPENADVFLEIAEEKQTPYLQNVDPMSSKSTVSLSSGNYRWRLKLMEAEQERITTPWIAFSILKLDPPEPLAPVNEANLSTKTSELDVNLSWRTGRTGRTAGSRTDFTNELEITRDDGWSNLRSTEGSNASFKLPLGRYNWRLRSVSPNGSRSAWSNVRQFTVAGLSANRPVPTPRILPKLTVTSASLSTRLRSASEVERVSLMLQWNAVPDAIKYRVSLYYGTLAVFENRVTQEPRLQFLVDSFSDEYNYEVMATLNDGTTVSSGRIHLPLELAAPVLKFPDHGTTLFSGDLVLTWERTLATRSYELQIADDPGFSNPLVVEEVPKNLYAFTPPRPGKYYWRVKSLVQKLETTWSPAHEFTVKSAKEPRR